MILHSRLHACVFLFFVLQNFFFMTALSDLQDFTPATMEVFPLKMWDPDTKCTRPLLQFSRDSS